MKKLLFTLLFTSISIQSLYAVQTGSPEDEHKALKAGKKVKNVCHVCLFFGKESKDKPFISGSGALIKPDVVATAGHLICTEDNDLKKKFAKGGPLAISGFVTFEPDVHKALSKYVQSGVESKYASKFYEVESAIFHSSYDGDPETDLAFIKLKVPVEGIEPLRLYKKGVIKSLGLHLENSLCLDNIIEAQFTGCGTDTSGRTGKKRMVSQLCFLEWYDESVSAENDKITPITAYVPSKKRAEIKVEGERNIFHKALYKKKRQDDVYGLIYRGDSGGALTVQYKGKDYLVGIESADGNSGLGKSCDLNLQDQIDHFRDVKNAGRAYANYLCPLFTLAGDLRPEVPEMLEKLKSFKGSRWSKFSILPRAFRSSPQAKFMKFLQVEKQELDDQETFLSVFETTFDDLENLLKLDLSDKKGSLKTLEKIEKKHTKAHEENKEEAEGTHQDNYIIEIDFSKAKVFLKENKIKKFKAEIKQKIDAIRKFKKEMLSS